MDEVTVTIVDSTDVIEITVLEPGTPVFGAPVIKTLSSGVVAAGAHRNLVIAAETGITDDMIELTGLSKGEKVLLRADSGDTITLKHNNGAATVKILIYDGLDFVLDEQHPIELVLTDTNKLAQILDEGGGSVADNSITNTKLADVDTNTIKGRATAGSGDPEDLSIAEQTMLGRITAGVIAALTPTQIRTLLNIADGATANPNALDKVLTPDQTVASNVAFGKQVKGGSATVVFSATKTFSMDNGTFQEMIVTAIVTSLAVSNKVNGSAYWIVLEIGGSGSYTIPQAGASFGTRTDNSVDDSVADWFPTTVGSQIIYTVGVTSSGKTFYSIEIITV